MVGFSRLQVSGYRRLRNLDLELRPFNVLIGANGVGKSSVLEVVNLLGDSAIGKLQDSLSRGGGIHGLLTQDRQTTTMRMAVEIPMGENPGVDYEIILVGAGIAYAIQSERLRGITPPHAEERATIIDVQGAPFGRISADGTSINEFPPGYKHGETYLSQMHGISFDEADWTRTLLAGCTETYHTLDISRRSPVRLPQPLQPADAPGADASLLLSCLYAMRETQRHRFEAVEDALRAAFPTFERLDLPAVAAGMVTLAWKDRAFAGVFYPHQLSEGTLRFLWLATLLGSPGLPPITLIDEPEVSLHPELLSLLADLMREASERTQLIVATHSDRFVRFLNPEELVICDLAEDGGMEVKRGSELDLEAWLEEYTLDQLWSKGRLGGRS